MPINLATEHSIGPRTPEKVPGKIDRPKLADGSAHRNAADVCRIDGPIEIRISGTAIEGRSLSGNPYQLTEAVDRGATTTAAGDRGIGRDPGRTFQPVLVVEATHNAGCKGQGITPRRWVAKDIDGISERDGIRVREGDECQRLFCGVDRIAKRILRDPQH